MCSVIALLHIGHGSPRVSNTAAHAPQVHTCPHGRNARFGGASAQMTHSRSPSAPPDAISCSGRALHLSHWAIISCANAVTVNRFFPRLWVHLATVAASINAGACAHLATAVSKKAFKLAPASSSASSFASSKACMSTGGSFAGSCAFREDLQRHGMVYDGNCQSRDTPTRVRREACCWIACMVASNQHEEWDPVPSSSNRF
jgi:hypothetical protein